MKTKYTLFALIICGALSVLFFDPLRLRDRSQRDNQEFVTRGDTHLVVVSPVSAEPPAQSVTVAAAPSALNWVVFFNPDDARSVGLNSSDVAALNRVCAETLALLMNRISRVSRIEIPSAKERSATWVLAAAEAQEIEGFFDRRIREDIGPAKADSLAKSEYIRASIAANLFHFGSRPMAIVFEAKSGEFENAERYTWTRILSADQNSPLILQGEISREGFVSVYGSFARQLLANR